MAEETYGGNSQIIFGVLIATFFGAQIIIKGSQNFFGVDIVAKLKNMFTKNQKIR